MKAATVKQLKDELSNRTQAELMEVCLYLSKFKKENKELLSYLLFESTDEQTFVKDVKQEVEHEFAAVNTKTYYFMRKGIRKILTSVKKYIRYSKKKETEVELMLHFCKKLKNFKPSIKNNIALRAIYDRQLISVKKSIESLHEDLQYDYQQELESL